MINREKLSLRLKLEIENGKMLHRSGLKKALELIDGLDDDEVEEPDTLLRVMFNNLEEREDNELVAAAGRFEDNSGSWIALDREDSKFVVSLDFSGDGTKLQNVQVFEKIRIVIENEKKVF